MDMNVKLLVLQLCAEAPFNPSDAIRVSNSLDQDQARQNVGPDLCTLELFVKLISGPHQWAKSGRFLQCDKVSGQTIKFQSGQLNGVQRLGAAHYFSRMAPAGGEAGSVKQPVFLPQGQEMKYRIEEGEISTESTEPKVIPSSSSSHNQSEDTPCPEEGGDGDTGKSSGSLPDDVLRKRVALVKLYAWIKEELSRSSARSVAHYLYQHDEHLLSAAEHENICNCKLRRDAVEQLLKRVLMGPDEIFDIFIEILKDQDEDHIAERLSRTAPTDREILEFAVLEDSSLHRCSRPNSQEPRFKMTSSDYQTLTYYLNTVTTIDTINDNLLSRFFFSIREHNNIVLCSMDHERRVMLLLDTMKLCSDKIFPTFCEILVLVEMEHVIRKLERKRQSLGKRKSTPDTNEIQNPSSSTPRAKRQCVDSCIEHRLVASIAKSASRLKQDVAEDLDFDLDTVNKGSIIIQLKPKSAESWKKLENNCLTGKIKDFIPKVYKNEAIHDLLKDGEYRLKFTIYTLPGFSQLGHTEEEGEKKAMFHLETQQGTPAPEASANLSPVDENPIEDQMDLLCEELEITKDLLDVLRKSKLVEEDIKEQISKQGSRAKKIKFLLKKLSSHGTKGYEVLKSHIKESNEDLYTELTSREGVKVIDKKLDQSAKVGKSRRTSHHRSIYSKQVFFTGVAVLKVKKLDPTKTKENVDPTSLESDIEITCPEILDPVCHFKSEDEGEDVESRGGVTMVLEEDWDSVGETAKPERQILVGKRKHKEKTSTDAQKSVKKQASEEGRETSGTEEETDSKEETSDTEDTKQEDIDTKSDEIDKKKSKDDNT